MTKTQQTKETTMRLIHHEEGLDGLGTPCAHVAVIDGDLYAQHSSFSRGGCLAAGTVVVRNVHTNERREIDVTSWASASDAHLRYLISLAEKHVGARVVA